MGKWESGIERGMTHGEMGVWYIYRERHDTWGNGSLVYIERGMTHGEMGVWYIYRERHDTWGNGSLVYIEREA